MLVAITFKNHRGVHRRGAKETLDLAREGYRKVKGTVLPRRGNTFPGGPWLGRSYGVFILT